MGFMKLISANVGCPNCGGVMTPAVVCCRACELEVKGNFEVNEFARLSAEELHFLRIFVHTEGSIREMESALGVSYPTIKARLAKLKAALSGDGAASAARRESSAPARRAGAKARAVEVLKELEAGRITIEEAAERIRADGEDAREVTPGEEAQR
jgi:hypothetical protein